MRDKGIPSDLKYEAREGQDGVFLYVCFMYIRNQDTCKVNLKP